jgi:FKBP-type peptidyl-prolyl cis-trans isomerase (trigger factor)
VVLDSLQCRRKFEFWQNNDTVAAIDTCVADDDESVDVRHRKEAQYVLGVVRLIPQVVDHLVSVRLLKCSDLHCLGLANAIPRALETYLCLR